LQDLELRISAPSRKFSACTQWSLATHTAPLSTSGQASPDIIPLRKQLKDAKKAARRKGDSGAGIGRETGAVSKDWELTVGIEVHAQLDTDAKLFSEPYARNGRIWLGPQDGISKEDGDGILIGIKQIQMEQDTAKTTETPSGAHLLDLNRVSRPLIEIITLPQIHSPETAAACVKKIQAILQSVGAVTTGMEMGGLRADVNVSVRRRDSPLGDQGYHGICGLGQRTEIKNLSSFKAVEDAVRAEMNRQVSILEAGGVIVGETRRWSIGQTETKKLRGKGGEVDYRYMPDPDLAPVIISDEFLDELRKRMPQLPDAQLEMLTKDPKFGMSVVDAKALTDLDNGSRLEYYHDVVDAYLLRAQEGDASQALAKEFNVGRVIANWVLHEIGGLFTKAAEVDPEVVWSASRVPATKLAEIIHLQHTRRVTSTSAKQILLMIFNGDERAVGSIVEEEKMELKPMTKDEYVALAHEVLSANPDM
ncbi:hypothetical protein KEM54_003182, partial [Ascosphaera aggregata]